MNFKSEQFLKRKNIVKSKFFDISELFNHLM